MNTETCHNPVDRKKGRNRLKLNTNGSCLFCLSAVENFREGGNNENNDSLISLSALFRYVSLNVKGLDDELGQFMTPITSEVATIVTSIEDSDILSELCTYCKEVCKKVLDLIEMMESLEKQVNNYLVTIRQGIKEADECPDKILEFRRRLNHSEIPDETVLNPVEHFRKKFSNECFKRVSMTLPSPKVELTNPNDEADQIVEIFYQHSNDNDEDDDDAEMEEEFITADPLSPDPDISHHTYSNDGIEYENITIEDVKLEVLSETITNTSAVSPVPVTRAVTTKTTKKEKLEVAINTSEKVLINLMISASKEIGELRNQVTERDARIRKLECRVISKNSIVRTKSGDIKCEICDKTFASIGNANRHYLAFHTSAGPKKEKCPYCPYEGLKWHLSIHIKKKHPRKNNEPQMTESEKQILPKLIKENNGKFNCAKCEKTFSKKYDCGQHIKKVHFGLRANVKCELCGVEIGKKYLKTHRKTIHGIQ